MSAPRAEIYVPTRGHIWHQTAARLNELCWHAAAAGEELPLTYVRSKTGVVQCRNQILNHFLSNSDSPILVMCDDDVIPHENSLQLIDWIEAGDAQIVGAPCPIIRPGLPILPNVFSWTNEQLGIPLDTVAKGGFRLVDAVGFGLVAIHRPVLAKLKRFKERFDKDGGVELGEDVEFCLRAKSQGFKVAVDLDIAANHVLTVHGNDLAFVYSHLIGDPDDENAASLD